MSRARHIGALLVACLLAAGVPGSRASADAVTLRGTTIPIRGCGVLDIRSGRVHFRNAGGRRLMRELDDVTLLSFDDLPELDEAEIRYHAGDTEGAVHALLQALLRADREVERLWVRARLARVHDERGEYVQAAGHAAAVLLLREESHWASLEPMSRPNDPGYPATREAWELLAEARQRVRLRSLRPVVERLSATVEPIHARRRAAWRGPKIPPNGTRSGWPLDRIRAGSFDEPPFPLAGAGAPTRGARAGSRPDEPAPADEGAWGFDAPRGASGKYAAMDAPAAIEALLREERFAEAMDRCERVAKGPGDRALGLFLHQHGRALLGVGRPRDAAIMFMRCAILHESSVAAAPSLLETAKIYRDFYRNDDTARRLAERAMRVAPDTMRNAVEKEANALLATLGR
ncbi:MAG: hypothetical protein GY715_18020 [Planctomycetes bacterium]|nr:hypothetical protein [Planctomycetota bacterium]